MIHLTKVQLLIVWICLHISTQAKGSITHENSIEEKLIMVNPSVTYEDRPGIDCNAGDCFEKDSCTCCDEKIVGAVSLRMHYIVWKTVLSFCQMVHWKIFHPIFC